MDTMSSLPTQTQAEFDDEATRHYRCVLRTLVDLATKIATDIAHETSALKHLGTPTPGSTPGATPDTTPRFERIARTIRRCILLERKLAQPTPKPRPAANPPLDRTATRKRIIREVEDAIDHMRSTHDVDVDRLEAELLDRLDRPDLEADLATQPIEIVIADLASDLGVVCPLDRKSSPGKRRTPEDIDLLQARAAAALPTEPRSPRTSTRAPPPEPIEPLDDPAKAAALTQALAKLQDADL